MATNYKNTRYYAQTTKDTVPASTAGTGTITSTGTSIVGLNTLFIAEVKPLDWIYIPAQDEVRKVLYVTLDTTLILDKAFTTPLVGSAFDIVSGRENIKQITLSNLSTGATAEIDGEAFAAGTTVEFRKQAHESSQYDEINPVVLEATGTTVQVSILK